MSVVIVTGARGYIGSALAKRLSAEGHTLQLVSRVPGASCIDAGDAPNIKHIAADLRDERAWISLLTGADIVVHLSSRTDLRAAEMDPVGDEEINVEPIRALVRATTGGAVPVVIFASTVTIVGVNPQNPVDEQTPDDPCSVYDRHKLACETILREATARGIVRACSLRLSNIYGYGGTSVNANRGILNVMLRRAAHGEPLTLFGAGSYIRDFTHLDDVIDAFCRAISSAVVCDGRHYVITTGRGHTVAEAFNLISKEALLQTRRRIEIRHVAEPNDLQPIERRNFIGNSRLFRELTGWRPRFDLRAGIRDYFIRTTSHQTMTVGR